MGRHRTAKHVFGADFETDNDGVSAWVVQWAVSDGNQEWYGPDLESYAKCVNMLLKRYKNIVFYVHNLKYDIEFEKSLLHSLEEYGCELKILMRRGNPIQIRAEKDRISFTLRDSMKKLDGDLRSIGHMVGLEK